MKHIPVSSLRHGTILIIVAGIAGLLASVAIAFLARIRNDVDDMAAVVRETQARIMLAAACNYIQEASRIGWEPDNPTGNITEHLEAHGWIDVRDGSLGPRFNSVFPVSAATFGAPLQPFDPGNRQVLKRFPINTPRSFPMYRMRRPPYAIQLKTGYNPVLATDKNFPYLRYPDPQPVVNNGWNQAGDPSGGSVSANNWSAYEKGDQTPINESVGLSWFRIVREKTGAVFTVTCGAGGTWGFKSFGEAQLAGKADLFDSNIKVFESLRNAETITWYRLEWSPAIAGTDFRKVSGYPLRKNVINFTGLTSINSGLPDRIDANLNQGTGACMSINYGGTISWIQRLRSEPKDW